MKNRIQHCAAGPCPRRLLRIVAVATLVPAVIVVLAGCNLAPGYRRPVIATPSTFKELEVTNAAATNLWKIAEPGDQVLRGNWWELFGDPELNALETQAAVSNQTVAAALANLFSARAVIKQNRSQLFPDVTANPSVTKSRQSSLRGSGPSTNSLILTEYSLPLDASWELDFWGRIRNSVRASRFEAQASLADLENARLSVQAEVAADYFQLRALDEQKYLLDAAVAAYEESLRLTRVRHDTGIASDQDVAQAETQYSSTAAQATDIAIQRALMEHALAVLTGRAPADLSIPHESLTARPVPVPPGVPSSLLERRPDIAAAERRVAEANAQIGVARAGYFPAVTLTGSVGYQSTSTANLFSGPALVWSVGGALAQTLFDAGNHRAIAAQAWAHYNGVAANYRETVLNSFREVEDNLSAVHLLVEEVRQEDAAVAASQRYLNLANDRYKLGLDSYLNVVVAQTALLNNQRTAVNLRLQQATASVQLIKALGGGWSGTKLTAKSTNF